MLYKEDFGEGKNIEFKREIPKRHEKLLKDVIAFSNSTGVAKPQILPPAYRLRLLFPVH